LMPPEEVAPKWYRFATANATSILLGVSSRIARAADCGLHNKCSTTPPPVMAVSDSHKRCPADANAPW
jgi:hypothetical protein